MHQVKSSKVEYHGIKFDSIKERDFFIRYVEPSGLKYECHPRFEVIEAVELHGKKFRQAVYTPDFVVYNDDGSIKHVYDVKNGFSTYGIDAAAKLRFKLFVAKYHHPVEAVVMYKKHFKTKVLGTTKRQSEHVMQAIDYQVWDVMK